MLCVLFICVICEKKYNCETRWAGFSLTELTEHLSQSKRMDSNETGYLLMGKFASDDAINRKSTSTCEP